MGETRLSAPNLHNVKAQDVGATAESCHARTRTRRSVLVLGSCWSGHVAHLDHILRERERGLDPTDFLNAKKKKKPHISSLIAVINESLPHAQRQHSPTQCLSFRLVNDDNEQLMFTCAQASSSHHGALSARRMINAFPPATVIDNVRSP